MFTQNTKPVAKEGVSKPQATMEKPSMGKGMVAKPAEDHKAAIAKMHPEHLHKMVKAAHAGEYGPKAQAMAQQAMQGAPGIQSGAAGAPPINGDQDGASAQSSGKDYAGMFGMGAGGAASQGASQPMAKPDRASMFDRSRGGM